MAQILTSQQLRGLIPPMVSPLQLDGSLDIPAVRRLIDHLVAGGVQGIFVLGTTGEGVSLSYRKRYQLVEAVGEATAGRVPVLVGVSDNSLEEAKDLAEHAFASGASAIVATPTFYLPISDSHVEHYFHRLADESSLPLVLYNMPSCTKISLEIGMIARLAEHPRILGLKDSSGDINYLRKAIEQLDGLNFPVLVGPEEMVLEGLQAGAVGGVNGGGLLFPALYARRISAFLEGDLATAKKLDTVVQQVVRRLYTLPTGRMAVIETIKLGLSSLGLCQPWLLPPLVALDSEQRDRVVRAMSDLELLVEEALPAQLAGAAAE